MSRKFYLIPVAVVIVVAVLGYALDHSSPTSKVQQLKLASANSSIPTSSVTKASVASTTSISTPLTSSSTNTSSSVGSTPSDTASSKSTTSSGASTTSPVSNSSQSSATPTLVSTTGCYVSFESPDPSGQSATYYYPYTVEAYSNGSSVVYPGAMPPTQNANGTTIVKLQQGSSTSAPALPQCTNNTAPVSQPAS